MWVLVTAGLVFVMQPGFACLESGLTRSKNSINVAVKNVTDAMIALILFWLVGFGIMFGITESGWVGTNEFMIPFTESSWHVAFFLFQAMFVATAATIVSGAVAERMKFEAYLIMTALISAVIYPLFGHWAWNGSMSDTYSGWLGAMGFRDFAGSTVVHSIGGWASLAALVLIGPRTGRFNEQGVPRQIPGSNIPLAALGVLLLWFGWFGFNGGSTLGLTERVPMIIVNTFLAGAAGGLSGIAMGYIANRKVISVDLIFNGSLAGLVSVTASANVISPLSAILIGIIAGPVFYSVHRLLLKFKIDDAVDAVPVHLGGGIWGTLAVAIFADPAVLGTGLNFTGQLGVQALGIAVAGVWTFLLVFIVLWIVNKIIKLRVSEEDEHIGLNVSEHGATTEILDLFIAMDQQAKTGDMSLRVPVEPFTEVGQIANRYNRVMEALERAIRKTEAIVTTALDGIITFTPDQYEILTVNPGGQAMFKLAEKDLAGTSLIRLFDHENAGYKEFNEFRAAELFKQVEQTGTPVELVGKRADGTVFPMEVIVTKADLGFESFYTGMFRDITERKEAEAAILAAKKETDDILYNINEGIFLLNEKFEIGSQHSLALRKIFRRQEMSQLNLLRLFSKLVPSKTYQSIQDYLELMFQLDIDEDIVNNLNPLKQIEVNFEEENGQFTTQYLQFKFSRIYHGARVSHLMTTVSDVSEQVLLARELKASEERTKNQMSLLFNILHIDPLQLKPFVEESDEAVHKIKSTLKAAADKAIADDYYLLLTDIYRIVHNIKGNASILDLKFFAESAHELEDMIRDVQSKPSIKGEDFITLLFKISDLEANIEDIKSLVSRLMTFQNAARSQQAESEAPAASPKTPDRPADLVISQLTDAIRKLSSSLNKQVDFNTAQFDGSAVHESQVSLIRDVLIQLMRNSLVHGIESPEDRSKSGKPATGTIQVTTSVTEEPGYLSIKLRDDGRGLQIEKIRQKAISMGKWNEEQLKAMPAGQVVKLIFEPGFSTADEVTMDAGRGVGMDLIRKNVTQAGGKISLASGAGKFCEFTVKLPLKS